MGHKGHSRDLLSSEQVDTIIDCPLPVVCACGGKITSQGGINVIRFMSTDSETARDRISFRERVLLWMFASSSR